MHCLWLQKTRRSDNVTPSTDPLHTFYLYSSKRLQRVFLILCTLYKQARAELGTFRVPGIVSCNIECRVAKPKVL